MAFVCVLGALYAGCGGGNGETAPSAVARSVTVALVQSGSGYQGTAVAAFSDGSSREVTADAQWNSTEATVATVDSQGRITILKTGTTNIRATYQSITGGAALTVATPPSPPAAVTYTLSGSFRDSLDGLATSTDLDDPDVCCLVEITASDGSTQRREFSRASYSFASVPAGTVRITVRPYHGWAEQTRTVNLGANTTADFALVPLPFRLWGEVGDPRTEARGPACSARIEILDGLNRGRSATTTPPRPDFVFSGLIQPDTATLRFSAPGGYATETRTVRLRGSHTTSSDTSGRTGANLSCPGCPSYSSMTCP